MLTKITGAGNRSQAFMVNSQQANQSNDKSQPSFVLVLQSFEALNELYRVPWPVKCMKLVDHTPIRPEPEMDGLGDPFSFTITGQCLIDSSQWKLGHTTTFCIDRKFRIGSNEKISKWKDLEENWIESDKYIWWYLKGYWIWDATGWIGC